MTKIIANPQRALNITSFILERGRLVKLENSDMKFSFIKELSITITQTRIDIATL